MKPLKMKSLFIYLVIIFTLIVSGCSGDRTKPVDTPNDSAQPNEQQQELTGDQFALLQQYTDDVLKKTKIESIRVDEVYQKVVLEGDLGYFVVDIRSAADFAKGHIEGAVNIPYALTANPRQIENLPKDKKVIVVCYSGHTAGQTAIFWNMLGYDTVPMMNGMGGWKQGAGTPLTQFEFPVVTEKVESKGYTLPSIKEENITDLQALIIKRSQNYLGSGVGPVINAPTLKEKVLDKEDSTYFLVDIREAKDYVKGHIMGSVNIPALNIAELENLKKLPADKRLVVIGYDGTDGSQIARVLNQLGYESYPLLQGMRAWTTNEEVNGIAPVSTEVIKNRPVKILKFELDGGAGGSASCG